MKVQNRDRHIKNVYHDLPFQLLEKKQVLQKMNGSVTSCICKEIMKGRPTNQQTDLWGHREVTMSIGKLNKLYT